MEVSMSRFSPKLRRFFVLCYSFTNRAIGGVALGGISLALKHKDVNITVHVVLVTFGFIQFMSQGLLAMEPGSGWEEAFPNQKKCKIHWRIQALGTLLAFIGTIYAIIVLERKESLLLSFSLHGLMGFTTMFLTVVTVILGWIIYNSSYSRYSCTKICHSVIGCITMTLAFVTYILGMQKSIEYSKSNKNVYLYIACAVVSIIGILTTPLTRLVRKLFRSPAKERGRVLVMLPTT